MVPVLLFVEPLLLFVELLLRARNDTQAWDVQSSGPEVVQSLHWKPMIPFREKRWLKLGLRQPTCCL